VSTHRLNETPAPLEPAYKEFSGWSSIWKKPVMWHGENALAFFMFDALEDNVQGEALDKNSVWIV
jgi:hypothetical protein